VAGVVWYYSVSGFSVDAKGQEIAISSDENVQEVDFVVVFFFNGEFQSGCQHVEAAMLTFLMHCIHVCFGVHGNLKCCANLFYKM
jgi:hypothetical protein